MHSIAKKINVEHQDNHEGHRRLGKCECVERIPSAFEDSLDLIVTNRGKDDAMTFNFNFSFAIKLAIGLNVFLQEDLTTRKLLSERALELIQGLTAKKSPPHHGYRSFGLQLFSEDAIAPLLQARNFGIPNDFAKPIKEIILPQDVPSTSDHHLIELKNQVQRLMEAHLAHKSSVQKNKITSSCEICSGPHDTQYCMENLEQSFVDYASLRTDKARGKWLHCRTRCKYQSWVTPDNPSWGNVIGNLRLSKFEADFKQQQGEMTSKIDTVLKAINDRITGALPSDTVKNSKLNVNSTSRVLSAHSYPTKDSQCSSYSINSTNAYRNMLPAKRNANLLKSSLDIRDKVDDPCIQSTLQVLPSFEEYTPPVTYPEEVEETLGTPMEVEPLNLMKLENVGFDNHSIPTSYKEVPIFDEPKPQPQPLRNCPSLDVIFDETKLWSS
ncbi:hypothetical protein Tco_0717938 [Tanacetum coccineum]